MLLPGATARAAFPSTAPQRPADPSPAEAGDREALAQLDGAVLRTIFHNPDNDYRVLAIRPDGASGEDIIAVGTIPAVGNDEHVRLRGRWSTHPRHGRQFQIHAIEIRPPATLPGITRYLATGLAKGVGPKTADKLVSAFGEKIFDTLDADPTAIDSITGIPRKIRELIKSSWKEKREEASTLAMLHSAGIGQATIAKILKKYGKNTPAIVTADTYRLPREIPGVGFPTADKMALNLGIDPGDPRRAEAGVLHVLDQAVIQGHTALPLAIGASGAGELLSIAPDNVRQALDRLESTREIVSEQTNGRVLIYPRRTHARECGFAQRMRDRARHGKPSVSSQDAQQAAQAVKKAQLRLGITLETEQETAAIAAAANPTSVITGAPGTGKTTVLRVLLEALDIIEPGHDIECAAPTGKASKRIAEVTRHGASTIHRLLEFDPRTQSFTHNESNPLKIGTLVVDEASMIDLPLIDTLIKAITPSTRLVLIGDPDQLPPVAYGQPFQDIIAAGLFPTARLSRIHRQATNSAIVAACHDIKTGRMPRIPSPSSGMDLRFISADSGAQAADIIVSLCAKTLPKVGWPTTDIQVLSPMNKGHAGVRELNERLAPILNPLAAGAADRRAIRLRHGEARIGDRVQQLVNNYAKGVFNGDQGTLIAFKSFTDGQLGAVVEIDGCHVEYDPTELDELVRAYAITIHKSQGSEYPVVIIPLVSEAWIMMRRPLLYTALARAQALAILVGQWKCLARAVRNAEADIRHGALLQRLATKQ